MALACRRNYFKRSYSPTTLIILHDLIQYSLPFLSLVPFCQLIRQFKESLVGAPTPPSSAFALIVEYLLLTFFCLSILSSGSFIISLTIYIWFFNRSFVLPPFHPFLHPLFVTMFGILLPSRPPSTQSENDLIGSQELSHKTHNYVGRYRLGELTYEDYDELSPSSRHIWISIVQLDGTTYGQGQGSRKDEAREQAAANALAALQQEYNRHPYTGLV
ncbi:hypothetical protein JOM56_009837 [Amanita muscaria]